MSETLSVDLEKQSNVDVRAVVRQAIEEFVQNEQRKAEPVYKAELQDEKRRRESLETRVNQLVEENRQARAVAEEADRSVQIRSELQRLGVAKVDLAFRAVKDDITRGDDGRLTARGSEGKTLSEFLTGFVQENPELLPARIAGGSGLAAGPRQSSANAGIDLDQIKPGMKTEDLERVRQEIARLASQSLRGN